jgi:uncharacterized membrane protein YuzA (DUF378 family)
MSDNDSFSKKDCENNLITVSTNLLVKGRLLVKKDSFPYKHSTKDDLLNACLLESDPEYSYVVTKHQLNRIMDKFISIFYKMWCIIGLLFIILVVNAIVSSIFGDSTRFKYIDLGAIGIAGIILLIPWFNRVIIRPWFVKHKNRIYIDFF